MRLKSGTRIEIRAAACLIYTHSGLFSAAKGSGLAPTMARDESFCRTGPSRGAIRLIKN